MSIINDAKKVVTSFVTCLQNYTSSQAIRSSSRLRNAQMSFVILQDTRRKDREDIKRARQEEMGVGYLMEEGGERGMRLAFDTACQRPEGQRIGADSQTDV